MEVFERLVGKQPDRRIAPAGTGSPTNTSPFSRSSASASILPVNAYFHSQRLPDLDADPYTAVTGSGDILELPVSSWTMVRDNRDAPETRAFAPNATAGDPVSVDAPFQLGAPRFATYVSHSRWSSCGSGPRS